jgi:hypothetical protein
MNLKLKALGLGLLAALALGAFAGVSATAETGGHFITPGVTHAQVNQISGADPNHQIKVFLHGLETEMLCDEASATGTGTAETLTEVEGSTVLKKCHTAGQEPGTIIVHMNGCTGRGTVAKGTTGSTEQTEELVCPAGKTIVITHPNCTITVPPQTNIAGWTYTPIKDNGVDTITIDVNLEYAIQYHGGICVFMGTAHTATAKGSTIVRVLNTEGKQISATAT